jgi:hypothetical protein
VARNGTNWTVTGNQAVNNLALDWPEATSGSQTVTHVSIGTLASGAGTVLYRAALSPNRLIESGVILRIAANNLDVNEE